MYSRYGTVSTNRSQTDAFLPSGVWGGPTSAARVAHIELREGPNLPCKRPTKPCHVARVHEFLTFL